MQNRSFSQAKSMLFGAVIASISFSSAVMAADMSAEAVAEKAGPVASLQRDPAHPQMLDTEFLAKNATVPYVHQDDEPLHRRVLDTDYLSARDVTIPPGVKSLYHLHEDDAVVVVLEGADLPQEIPGEQTPAHRVIPTGSIYFKGYSQKHFVHSVGNVDTKPFRTLEIALKAERQGLTLDKLGDAWTVALDNDRVRVSKVTVQPGATLAPASFKGNHLFIALTDASYAVGDLQLDVKKGNMLPDSASKPEVIRNTGVSQVELAVLELK